MRISSVNNNQSFYRNYYQEQQAQRNRQHLASGKKVNTAADNAAALEIIQKLLSQSNGYDMGSRNAATSQDMLNVADGSLSTVTDSMQRIRELSIQASNTAVYGSDDIESIQQEISQLKGSISDAANYTEFNKMNILDGSMGTSHVASDPSGGGMNINMPNAVLQSLGLENYDVTKNFDISSLDSAMNKISTARSSLGAASNRLDHTINYNSYASLNTTAARSRLEDLDFAQAISEMKKNSLLQEYRTMMQKKQQNNFMRMSQRQLQNFQIA